MLEKLFDYGDSKFRVIISDELIIDPNTSRPVQVRVNPYDCHDLVQTVRIYTPELSRLVLINGLSYAVRAQFDNFAIQSKPDDPRVGANDYFWSLESLLQVSVVFVQDVFAYLRRHKYKIKK